jgi:4-hydroxy-2-oxoglutarate aldolase
MNMYGVFPALVTPFRNGKVDAEGLAHNVQRWNDFDLAGYVVLGSTGEFLHLTPKERDEVITTVLEYATVDKTVMVGTGSLSTDETIRLTKRAAELGAHAALVVNPFYYKAQMTSSALRTHYSAVADASVIPIMLYNVPLFTQVNIEVEIVAHLAEHPNVIGIKDSSGDIDRLMQISDSSPEDFFLLTGVATILYPALVIGADGAVLAIANAMPELCIEIYRLVQSNEHELARRQQKLLSSVTRVIKQYGVGGFSTAMEILGYHGSELRRPLSQPDSVGHKMIRQAIAMFTESCS